MHRQLISDNYISRIASPRNRTQTEYVPHLESYRVKPSLLYISLLSETTERVGRREPEGRLKPDPLCEPHPLPTKAGSITPNER